MSDLHMEGLDDDDVIAVASQALGSLHARFVEDDERVVPEHVREALESALNAFDTFEQGVGDVDDGLTPEQRKAIVAWKASCERIAASRMLLTLSPNEGYVLAFIRGHDGRGCAEVEVYPDGGVFTTTTGERVQL